VGFVLLGIQALKRGAKETKGKPSTINPTGQTTVTYKETKQS
jgi:hypothetical protein